MRMAETLFISFMRDEMPRRETRHNAWPYILRHLGHGHILRHEVVEPSSASFL